LARLSKSRQSGQRIGIPAREAQGSQKAGASIYYDPGSGFAFPELDYPGVSANSVVMAALEAAIQKNTRYSKL
jgi:hypothetical protein